MKQTFIGEVKTQSPFGFHSPHSWLKLFNAANDHADMISIHTDERWGGRYTNINHAAFLTKKPILAKGIHLRDYSVETCIVNGAMYVLVVGRLPSPCLRDACYIEPTSIKQLLEFADAGVRHLVWNSRDLTTGKLKTETWEDVRKVYDGPLIQASNIKTKADVKPDASAFIVGECLIDFCR